MRRQRSIVTCGHLECVADIPRDGAFRDTLGTYWCAKHRVRGLLINYGAKHNFPEVDFHPYAIGNDEGLWRIAAMCGNAHMLELAASVLGLVEVEV